MRIKTRSHSFLFLLKVVVTLRVAVPSDVWAGAAVAAQRQAAQRQAAYQEILQERAYQEAYQQAYLQRAAQERAAIQQKAYQQQVSQLVYQRQVAQQQRAVQEQLQYRSQIHALQREASQRRPPVPQALESSILQSSPPREIFADPDSFFADPLPPDEVVDIYDIWEEMAYSSEVWRMMMDRAPKEQTVKKYIDFFKQQNVMVRKAPNYYVDLIDQMSQQSPDMLQRPFEDVFRLLTIMEYDFDNGVDPDALAQQVLGPQLYQQNKQRLGR